MGYEIIWSEFAEKQIDDIINYFYHKSGSYGIALKIVSRILFVPNILSENLRLGQIEPYLKNRNITYHYLVESSYKITYSIDEKDGLIKVADVFDNRQSPEKMERKK